MLAEQAADIAAARRSTWSPTRMLNSITGSGVTSRASFAFAAPARGDGVPASAATGAGDGCLQRRRGQGWQTAGCAAYRRVRRSHHCAAQRGHSLGRQTVESVQAARGGAERVLLGELGVFHLVFARGVTKLAQAAMFSGADNSTTLFETHPEFSSPVSRSRNSVRYTARGSR